MRALPRATAAVAAALLSLPVAAHAADETNIDHVQVNDKGMVSVLLAVDGIPAGQGVDPGSVSVTVDGKAVDGAKAETVDGGTIQRTTILALDASNSMRGARFEAAKAAAKAFLQSAPEDVRIGLLTFSGKVHDVTQPTTDHQSLAAAVDRITLTGGTAVYDAVKQAVDLSGTSGARSILLLSDGKDQGKGATLQDATAEAADNGVVVDVVSMDQAPSQLTAMTELVSSTGGELIPADPAALSQVFTDRADALAKALVVTFTPPAGDNTDASLEISVDAGGTTYTDKALVSLGDTSGTAVQAVQAKKPVVGTLGLLLGALAAMGGLVFLAVMLFAGMSAGKRSLAQRQIALYTGQLPANERTAKDAKSSASLKDSAVAAAEKVVSADFESKLMSRLQGAGFAFTPAEWLLLHSGIAVVAAMVGAVFGGAPMAVLGLLIGAALPFFWLRFKHGRRLAAFNTQLAETLNLIAGGLSAGLSMPQAIDTVLREGAEPMAGELKRAMIEARLGVDLTDALESIADRMESEDFKWVVMAIRIQREVGGNLAELLMTVADTLRERDYLRRQVRVLSAEGRFSAYVLGCLPIGMFAYLMTFKRDFVAPLIETPTGWMMLGVGGVMLAMGFFSLSKIVKVEV